IERLKKELKKKKKYGLVWEEKPEDVVEMCKEKLPVLKEVKGKEIITDKNKPMNLLIEGDNYHALSVLNYTHKGKIDVIYIDPPYNTGNKDFIYNDHYIEKEDSYRHSKWLSFVAKRLKLAKNLLKDTGIIFISIDDNEVSQLKLLMDSPDLFGESNFVAQFIWNKKTGRQNDAKFVSTNHEYILCYLKNVNKGKINLLPRTEELNKSYKNLDKDPRGPWASVKMDAKSGSKSSLYEITFPNGIKWKPSPGRYPAYNKENLLKLYNDNRIWFGESGKNVPRQKVFLSEVQQGLVPNTLLLAQEVGNTQKAKEDYKKVLPNVDFDNPKPLGLIKYLSIMGGDKDANILDFMAGSGTTGHAVLEMNKDDGGNRKFILCTNNENKICEEVTYPRVQRVIKGYRTLKGEKIDGLGGNLKYFKTDFVDYKESTDKNKIKLTKEAVEMLCVKEGTFESVLENEDFKIFKNHNHYTGIIFDQLAIEDFKKAIKDIKVKISVYIFSLGDDSFEDEFKDIKQKVKLSPIPEAILKVYRRIYK
ncbi:MAG: site-specific DNA-methyltransferase, partial [Candidatus Paceibacterota bacterium]